MGGRAISGSSVQVSDESAWRDGSKCFFDDGGDLVPVDLSFGEGVEHYAKPSREHPTARRGRHEEGVGIRRAHLFWNIGRSRAPDGHPLVAVMMIVEVAEGSVVVREEARDPVANAFADTWQIQRDRPQASEEIMVHVSQSRAERVTFGMSSRAGRAGVIDSVFAALTLSYDRGIRW